MANVRNVEKLMHLVERYNLFHVKTLHYNDLPGVLDWLGVRPGVFAFSQHEDTVTVLNRLLPSIHDVAVVGIDAEPRIEGKKRVIVYIRRNHGQVRYDTLVLFLVVRFNGAPYNQERSPRYSQSSPSVSMVVSQVWQPFRSDIHGVSTQT